MKAIQEWLAVAALAAAVIFCLIYWNELPPRIPIHFGLSGQPDGYTGRDALWILVALDTLLFVGMSVLSLLPRLFNLTVSRSDPRRSQAERLAIEMLGWVKVEVLWLFAFLIWKIIAIACGRTAALGVACLPVLLLTLAVTIGWYALRSRDLTFAAEPPSNPR